MPTEYFLAFSGDVISPGYAAQLGTIFMRDHLFGIMKQEGNIMVDLCVYNQGTAVMISTLWDSQKNRASFRKSLAFKNLAAKTKHFLVQGKFEVELKKEVG